MLKFLNWGLPIPGGYQVRIWYILAVSVISLWLTPDVEKILAFTLGLIIGTILRVVRDQI